MARVARGERGSLPMAMLLVLVSVGLSATALPAAMTQIGSTRQTVNREGALRSAQTGLEVALARVRSLTTYNELCGNQRDTEPITFVASSGTSRYTVTAQFWDNAAEDRPVASEDDPAHCGPTTRWMRLIATGTEGASQRRLTGFYPVRPGALSVAPYEPSIDLYTQPRLIPTWTDPAGGTGQEAICLDAVKSVPDENGPVSMKPCPRNFTEDMGINYKQYWYYRTDLTLATVGSLRAASDAAKAMCLDAGSDSPSVGAVPRMRRCVTPVPARQRWYYTNNRNFELGTAAGGLSGLCLNVVDPDPDGSAINLGNGVNCRGTTLNSKQHFAPLQKAGPGQAGFRTAACPELGITYPCELTQLRSTGAPNTCAMAVDSGNNIWVETVDDPTFVANTECFQHPQLTAINWAQLFRIPATPTGTGQSAPGPVYTMKNLTKYCLEPKERNVVRPVSCTGRAAQNWVRTGDTGDYNTKYRLFHPATGKCLTRVSPEETDRDSDIKQQNIYWQGYTINFKMMVVTCRTNAVAEDDDDDFNEPSLVQLQKWNSPGVVLHDDGSTGGGGNAVPAPTVSATPLRDVVDG
ncbi:hypothetical protein GCM10010123_36130 [Pilimelia anulata]|uniref:Ricin B lectin domain-containing protein n=1 Tax=Pilimelia anulata TaxID=53371 RepID=A0A8J3BF51_9ACTN|nr:hypothetical protein GCM10010123_36130 [Pilimelia anulata]